MVNNIVTIDSTIQRQLMTETKSIRNLRGKFKKRGALL